VHSRYAGPGLFALPCLPLGADFASPRGLVESLLSLTACRPFIVLPATRAGPACPPRPVGMEPEREAVPVLGYGLANMLGSEPTW